MQKIEGQMIQVKIPNDLLNRIDTICGKLGKTRAEVMRVMLEVSCDGFEPFMKVGILGKVIEQREKLGETVATNICPSLV